MNRAPHRGRRGVGSWAGATSPGFRQPGPGPVWLCRANCLRRMSPENSLPTQTRCYNHLPCPPQCQDRVLIIDFGSQFTQLIARRVREDGVYSEIVPFDTRRGRDRARCEPKARHPLGRPGQRAPKPARRARRRRVRARACRCSASATASRPWCAQLGGEVEGGHHREFGRAELEVDRPSAALRRRVRAGRARHRVDEPRRPRHAAAAGLHGGRHRPTDAPFAAIADEERKLYGVQFHPEVAHTPRGSAAARQLRASHRRPARATGPWRTSVEARSPGSARRSARAASSAASRAASIPRSRRVLIHEAIGDQLTCIFVDHGLLRAGRGRGGRRRCSAATTTSRWSHVDARRALPRRARRRHRPRAKRKTIGALFIDVFEEEAKKARRRRVPGAGHALSRRDRERVVHRRPVGDDQVAPQRRRPAGAHAARS